MDSGAFTTLVLHGCYPDAPETYAAEIRRRAMDGSTRPLRAVAQDYMCEPFMLAKTGLALEDHQRLTIERYDALLACDTSGIAVMPVLQGYSPQSYVEHIRQYGSRLWPRMWVGVGSVCKRNADPAAIRAVLKAIKGERPDLRLHGFGVKATSLACGAIRQMLFSADSLAWSYSARARVLSQARRMDAQAFDESQAHDPAMKLRRRAALAAARSRTGCDPNSWRDALRFGRRIATMPVQLAMKV